jgi:hypothetical protein
LDAQNAGNDISGIQIFKTFLEEYSPRPPLPFMRGILATHVAFSYCYPPLIYYLTERSLFKKCTPTGKSLKKALIAMGSVGLQNTEVTSLLCTGCPPKSTLYRNYPIVII